MASDAFLVPAANVASRPRVNEGVVAPNIAAHLPFVAMEGVMVGRGTGRIAKTQHDRIRRRALDAPRRMAEDHEGCLFTRIADDAKLGMTAEELEAIPAAGGLNGAGWENSWAAGFTGSSAEHWK